ncbi:hypothetical protein NQ314_013243 [Rhamnusium bicolor]|uniref:Uncharacterized protein n=1 Tax=Rhamnusium bicolor TaxID=1586634 RepID=A0AAV8X7W2_9CUCU|nr:hypothetical protein NQ314_013243 [Rhamnusium bicolor]
MDKFVKEENETVTSQGIQKRPINNFTTKEYTCRVLCLDSNKKKLENVARKKVFSPIIKKKIQQIQKIVDTDVTSDGSDCIESELRYFKPIDHRVNPPSVGKPPIRVPTKKPQKNTAPTILTSVVPIKEKNKLDEDKESPTLSSCSKTSRTKRQLFGKSNNIVQVETSSSPPFYGFENSDSKNNTSNIINTVKKNGIINITEDEKSKKLIQEMADLEFAKKITGRI